MSAFADRLNPIVLKELRQGLKSKSFVASFLGLQVLMVVSMFIYFAAVSTHTGDMEFADGFFWFMLGIILLLFMPLRSFGALYGELKGNTLEMLFLTRMSSWNIAFGKWLALLFQIGLLVCAVLPYLVLRYYLGAINVTADLVQLGLQVLTSSLLVALGVGLSSWTNKLMRGLLIFWALSSLYSLPFLLFSLGRTGLTAFAFWGVMDVMVWLGISILVMLYFVEYGASQIAPHAENHSIRKRGFALILLSILIPYAVFVERTVLPLGIGLGLLVPVMIDTLCEPVYRIGSLYRPTRKWGPLRIFLYAGWPSSFLLMLLLLAAVCGIATLMTGEPYFAMGTLALFNIVLFPFVFIRLIPKLSRKPVFSYILLQAAFGILFVFYLILVESLPSAVDWVSYFFFPIVGVYALIDDGADSMDIFLLIVPTLVMSLVHVIKAIPLWKAMNLLAKDPNS